MPSTKVCLAHLAHMAAFAERGAVVNKLKGQVAAQWDEASRFDAEKDKTAFRQYEEACDRVKNFYREQHGA